MSFRIQLMRNSSEETKVRKSVSTVKTLSGTLKETTSIIEPSITMEVNLSEIADCNYMYIPEFKRYYYITNIISVSNDLVQINGHVDVLMSFSGQFLNNNAIISRQENKWNLYLDDSTFKAYSNPNINIKRFPSGFTNPSFVLAVAGG